MAASNFFDWNKVPASGQGSSAYGATETPAAPAQDTGSAPAAPTLDGSGKFQFNNGQWSPYQAPAAQQAPPPPPPGSNLNGGQAGVGTGGIGYDQFGVQNGTGNIGTDSKGWEAAQAPGADGRDANGLPTYYQNVTLSQPGGPGAESINNPRFNQFLTQNSTNTLSDFLKSIGFDNTINDTNYSGGGGQASSPQHNININGNLMNAGLIQQRLNNNKNPDGTFNIEYFKKQMQDEINSNGFGGTQMSPFADGTTSGMGGSVPLTNNGIKYDYGMGAGAAVNPLDYQAASKAAGMPQAQGNAFNMYGVYGPGQGPNGPTGGQGGQGQGGMAGAGGQGGGGMAGAAWPRFATGGIGGGMYPSRGQSSQRPPALGGGMGGFQNGMQNGMYYPQSEPNMRQGMQSNFRNAGAVPQGQQQGIQQLLQMLMGGQGGQGGGIGQFLQMLMGGQGGGNQINGQNFSD